MTHHHPTDPILPPHLIAVAAISCGLCVAIVFYFWTLLTFGPMWSWVGP